MGDRLVSVLRRFELRAQVFQAGPLCQADEFAADQDLGYVHLLRRGRMRVDAGERTTGILERPSLVFFMAPTAHRVIPLGPDTDTVCASFEFGYGMSNPMALALPEMQVLDLADLPAAGRVLEALFEESAGDHCGRQAILDRLMEVLVILLLRELMDQGRIESGLLAGLADPRLARAINAMHAAPGNNWTLESLAAAANMSRARFAVRFREIVGITPMAYLGEWRLSVAQSLLRQGRAVHLIADEVGYASPSALTRAFNARLGVTPTEWRRHQRQ
jgi:AraC-like DNA-binding protein